MTFVCVLKNGGGFSPVWVGRLKRQVEKHLKPDRFVCLSDVDVPCERLPIVNHWPGWWSKVELFQPGLLPDGELVFYLDLDTLVVGPLPDPWPDALKVTRLAMLSDFYRPNAPASGAMAWIVGRYTETIYLNFTHDVEAGMQTRHGDGGFIGRHPHLRLQKMFPKTFGSYKGDCLGKGPGKFRIVCFHGKPKPDDFERNHWVTRQWLNG